jgi:hypothetical protein
MSNPNIERPNTVSGLIAKRAEIAGQIEVAQIELRRLIANLDHVDATIRLFAPDLATETIRSKRPMPPQHQALRGEVKRTVLDTMREARRPVTTAEIATKVLSARMLPATDPELRKLFVRRVGQCLHMMRGKGIVRALELPGRFQGWELV